MKPTLDAYKILVKYHEEKWHVLKIVHIDIGPRVIVPMWFLNRLYVDVIRYYILHEFPPKKNAFICYFYNFCHRV